DGLRSCSTPEGAVFPIYLRRRPSRSIPGSTRRAKSRRCRKQKVRVVLDVVPSASIRETGPQNLIEPGLVNAFDQVGTVRGILKARAERRGGEEGIVAQHSISLPCSLRQATQLSESGGQQGMDERAFGETRGGTFQ